VLTKPVTRPEFVIGKYGGLVLTLIVNMSVMTLAFYAVLGYMQWSASPEARAGWVVSPTDPAMLAAVALIGVELALVTAVALFFSTFSSPFLSALLTVGVWAIGHFSADFRDLEALVGSPAAGWIGRALYYVLPNFAAFDIKAQVVSGVPVSPAYVALMAAYGAAYAALVLFAAVTVFSRRDFK
jgi:ABC-type transport system involved in multi-copper enzyme maturation permease subunit